MKKFFNTAGPCREDLHYTVWRPKAIEPILALIAQEKYFIHHAPRQSGKTTLLLDMVKDLNRQGRYLAIFITVESAQSAMDDVLAGNRVILQALRSALVNMGKNPMDFPDVKQFFSEIAGVQLCLEAFSQHFDKPVVLVIDEIDTMVGQSLIALLRQLRAGYQNRPHAFPVSVILNGLRDLKDYRIYSKKEDIWLTGGSCFNIKAESIKLGNFLLEDVKELFSQHTKEHGQELESGLVEEIYRLSCGQPWLCNALGEQMCFKLFPKERILRQEHLKAAKEALILARTTHLDQLAFRLNEDRVKQIMIPMLLGETVDEFPQMDIEYMKDLGLLHQTAKPYQLANPIYQEVLPREMTYVIQDTIVEDPRWYVLPDGRLDFFKLIERWQGFWREHSHKTFYAREVTPHVLFMAYLQRLVNGGGYVHREYALGAKRLDLMVEYAGERFVCEIKIYRGRETLNEGLTQLSGYLNQLGLSEGYLLIFDPRKLPWSKKIRKAKKKVMDKIVLVYWQ